MATERFEAPLERLRSIEEHDIGKIRRKANIRAQDCKDLNRLSIEFSQRLTRMTSASFQGFQQRLSRIGHQCNENTTKGFLALFGKFEIADVPASQAKLISECSDFYIEEIRNGQQIVQSTFDEMEYWADRFTQAWSKLLGFGDLQLYGFSYDMM